MTRISNVGTDTDVPSDYYGTQSSGGGSSGSGSSSARNPATLVQFKAKRNGVLTPNAAPTPGNLLVWISCGFNSVTGAGTFPKGFIDCGSYVNGSNNMVRGLCKRATAADSTLTATMGSDNQAVFYEFANARTLIGLGGGGADNFCTGGNVLISCPTSPLADNDVILGALEHDTSNLWALTAQTGLNVDYTTPTDGSNHMGAIFRVMDPTVLAAPIAGTLNSPSSPVAGFWAVAGK